MPRLFSPIKKKEVDYTIFLLRRLLFNRIIKLALLLLFLILLIPVILFFILRPSPQKNTNYGVTFSQKYAEDLGLDWHETYIQILDDLGVKNVRLVAYWDDVEAVHDIYNFDDIKWQLDRAQEKNVNVILVIGRKVPRYPECHEPEWWHKMDNEELKNIELYEYVEQAVLALKDYKTVKMWQVENEPFFPFGKCEEIRKKTVQKEIAIVKKIDNRSILTQDSGEGGLWYPTYKMGDKLGISMYRKIWFDFWGAFLGRSFYFKYPLAYWTYKIKADLLRVPAEDIIVTELQAEPWGPKLNSLMTEREKDRTMSEHDFIATLDYAQKAGFKDLYLWGVEWWYWEKTRNNEPFYWNTAKAVF